MAGYDDVHFSGYHRRNVAACTELAAGAGRRLLTKKQLQSQSKRLGIRLPQQVIDFRVPYCLDVEIADQITADDNFMIRKSQRKLS
jgi:hypothetical protein